MATKNIAGNIRLIVAVLLTAVFASIHEAYCQTTCERDGDTVTCFDYDNWEHSDFTKTGDVWYGYNHSTGERTSVEIEEDED